MIGIAAGVVDRIHDIEQGAVPPSRLPPHRHDHGLVVDLKQARLLRCRGAGAYRLDASIDPEPRLIKETIEREAPRSRDGAGQANPFGQPRIDHRSMNSRRLPVDKAQTIDADQSRAFRIG